jgi:hypothetical protein
LKYFYQIRVDYIVTGKNILRVHSTISKFEMATVVPLSSLSQAQKLQIRQSLTFTPKPPSDRYPTKCEPVAFYRVVNDDVRLPYLFAAGLLQYVPNMNGKYSQLEWTFNGVLRPTQINVANTARGHLSERGTCTLGLYTGFGKTILAVALAAERGLVTAVILCGKILAGQWAQTFSKYGRRADGTAVRVCVIHKTTPIDQMMEADVIICLNRRAKYIPAAAVDRVGFVIFDEADQLCTTVSVECLLLFTPLYILVETATFERDDDMHQMLQAIVGTHGIFIEPDKAFTVYQVLTHLKFEAADVWADLVKAILYHPDRNNRIISIVQANPTHRCVILTSQVDHVMILQSMLTEAGLDSDWYCGNKKSYRDAPVLVGTLSKIGRGFDQESACDNYSGQRFSIVIIACSIKKYQVLAQAAGRGFRCDHPTVIHLVDDNPIIKRHWSKCAAWYRTRGAQIFAT